MTGALVSLFSLVDIDLPVVLAGHGYLGGSSREPSGDSGPSGIGTGTIIAVLVVGLVAVVALVWASPSARHMRLRTALPMASIGALIAMPLIVWTASSGGDDVKSLIVERAIARSGAPELIVSLGDKTLNTSDSTDGKRTVRVQCFDRDRRLVIDADQKWPFIDEPGYDYPHAHQQARREQVQAARRCRLRGIGVRLEAEVEGALGR
jgi:hypothetical protein